MHWTYRLANAASVPSSYHYPGLKIKKVFEQENK